jgi:hypothetical protein
MSVLITARFPGDTDQFRSFISSNEDRLRENADRARSSGCLHHRFGVGDGFVMVWDEWESPEQFQRFFEDPDLQALIQESGAQGEPDVTVTEAVETADQF